MRKIRKRLCAIMLILSIILLPWQGIEVKAEATILYSNNSGDLKWSIDTNGHLKITGDGNYCCKWFNAYIFSDWFYDYSEEIITAEIDVTGITLTIDMFKGCENLKSVEIKRLDTSNVTDMSGMFCGCKALTNINVSEWNTANVTDMSYMFYDCKALSNINISGWNTANVTDMSYMFYECESLGDVDVSKWDTSNVTNMKNMFYDCKSLGSVDTSKWDTSGVTNMENLFYNCQTLNSIDVSKWKTSKVTNMSHMFYFCKSLDSIDVSGFNTANVTNMSKMFYSCQSLDSIDVSGFNTANVTDMSYMFFSCRMLKHINVSEWSTSKVADMRGMFEYCYTLNSIDVGGWDTSKVTNMEEMFWCCESLSSIDVSKWKTSKVVNIEGMFGECKSINGIDVSGWDTTSIEEMALVFTDCGKLDSIDVRKWETGKVKSMNWIFKGCNSLKKLDISGWDTTMVVGIDAIGIEFCDNLTNVLIPSDYCCHDNLLQSNGIYWVDEDGNIVTDITRNLSVIMKYYRKNNVNGDIVVIPMQDISTEELFEKYPEYLLNTVLEKKALEHWNDCLKARNSVSTAENVWAAFKKGLKDGTEVIVKSAVGSITKKGYMEEEAYDEIVLSMVNAVSQNPDSVEKLAESTQGSFKKLKKVFETIDNTQMARDEVNQLVEALTYDGEKMFSKSDIYDLIKVTDSYYPDIEKAFEKVGIAVDVGDVLATVLMTESVSINVVKTLKKHMKKDNDTYKALERLEKDLGHPAKNFVKHYITNQLFDKMAGKMEELGVQAGTSVIRWLAGEGLNSAGGPAVFLATISMEIIADYAPGAKADDILDLEFKLSALSSLESAKSRQEKELLYNKQAGGRTLDIEEAIAENEILVMARNEMLKSTMESAKELANGSLKKKLAKNISTLSRLDFDVHIENAKDMVQKDWNAKYLYSILGDNLAVSGLKETISIKSQSIFVEDKPIKILDIPSVTENWNITSVSGQAFLNNTEITDVILPDTLVEIGEQAFAGCSNLTSIVIPEGVTTINSRAFATCTSLEYVSLPSSITHIADDAFEGSDLVKIMAIKDSYAYTFASEKDLLGGERPKEVSNIEIVSEPDCVAYDVFEVLDETGMQVKVNYVDGSSEILESGWVSYVEQNEKGEYIVNVIYQQGVEEYEIEIGTKEEPYTIRYCNEYGVDLTDAVTKTAVSGEVVTESAIAIDGYEAVEQTKVLEISSSYNEIIFTYEKIGKTLIKDMEITLSETQFTETGNPIYPIVTVKDDGQLLVENKDYFLVYSNHIDVGEAKVLVFGVGEYDGIESMSYYINKVENMVEPTPTPTVSPIVEPTPMPTISPIVEPTSVPTISPTVEPIPTLVPTNSPTDNSLQEPAQNVLQEMTKDTTIKIGDIIIQKKMKYKITKVNEDGNGEVVLTGTKRKKKDKKFKSLKIGSSIKINDKVFKITSIGSGAFSGYKYLKKISIGKNVIKIDKKAFYKCKTVKHFVIQSTKLKSVGGKAIKGINKKAHIKVPKKQLKKYKKLFRKKAGYKNSMRITKR